MKGACIEKALSCREESLVRIYVFSIFIQCSLWVLCSVGMNTIEDTAYDIAYVIYVSEVGLDDKG